MKRFAICLTLMFLMAAPAELPAGPPGRYNSKPFLKGLSKPYRKRAARKMGVRRLSDLTLYRIDMALNPALGTLDAHLEIIFTNRTRDTLPDLVLRIYANDSRLTRGDERNLQIVDVSVDGESVDATQDDPSTLRITLTRPLKPRRRIRLALDYHAEIPLLGEKAAPSGERLQDALKQIQDSQGRATYGVYARGGGIIHLGLFYPIIPSRVEGDWDTKSAPGLEDLPYFDAANYLVNLEVPENTVVASSGVLLRERTQGQKKKIRLMGTAVRTFALLLSSRYRSINREVGGTRVRVFHLAEHRKPAGKILTHTANALETYQGLFGPYPFPELDVAQAPLAGGAIGAEHPGLILMATLPAGEDPRTDRIARILTGAATPEVVLAHLVALQWWHTQVGSDSVRHPFLDEALARYATYLLAEARRGPQAAAGRLRLTLKLPYQIHRAQGGADGKVLRPAEEIGSRLEYAALIQSKGALFFHALRETMGKKRFARFLRRYLSRFAFRQAGPEDLLRLAKRAVRRQDRPKIEALYRRWLEETHGDEDIGLLEPAKLVKFIEELKKLEATAPPDASLL
jgi:aminopeptidase N